MSIDGWRVLPIGELCEGIYDGPHATPKKTPNGPVFLGISNLARGRLDLSVVEHLSEDDFARWTRRVRPQRDDVVFSYETRLGEAAIIPSGLRCCLGRRLALIRPDPSKVVPRYLLYAFLGPEFQEVIRARTVQGSTVDRILLTEFASFPIRVPSLSRQRRIANLLGALDDKIELNRRMNETLEGLGRALFKRLLHEAAGGQEVALGDIAEVVRGRSYRSEQLQPSTTALVTLKSFQRGGGYRDAGLKPYVGPYSAEQVIRHGEVVLACTDVTQAAEVVGRPAQVPRDDRFETLVVSLDGVIVRPKVDLISSAFLYRLLATDDFRQHAYAHTSGTTVLHLDRGAVPRYRFRLPDRAALQTYDEAVGPLHALADANRRESRTLAELRHLLLPKLISGGMRLGAGYPDLEEISVDPRFSYSG